jgi:putative ABC transport system permease protein
VVDAEGGPAWINETLVKEMEWAQPIGKRVGDATVIGVFRDFHSASIHNPIGPFVIRPYPEDSFTRGAVQQLERRSVQYMLKTSGNNFADMDGYIDEVFARFTAEPVLQRTWLSDLWEGQYEKDIATINLVGIFAGISVVLSLIGMAGLAAFATQLRSREIAIRKVLGASISQLLILLAQRAVLIAGIAVLPAAALAYYAMNLWLDSFAYQVDSSVLPYLAAAVIVTGFSIAAVVLQSWQAARGNPVKVLREN